MKGTDVAIIGGGIIGTSTAYELARRGATVQLFEAATLAAHQSGRNWGFVRQQGRSDKELPLMRDANRRWQGLEDELEEPVGWRQGGNLALTASEHIASAYREWVDVGRSFGVDTRLVDYRDVAMLVPGLEVPFTTGMFAASDGQADPRRATAAFAHAAIRSGAVVHCHTRVVGLRRRGDEITGIDTPSGVVRADVVVCAAGATSRRLLKTVGVELPQAVVRSTVAMTAPVRPITEATVWTGGLSFRQRADGRIVVATGGGGEVELTADSISQAQIFLPAFTRNAKHLRPRVSRELVIDLLGRRNGTVATASIPRPNLGLVRQAKARLTEALPAVAPIEIEHAWAGLIDSTPDALPVIDRCAGPSGLVIATGLSGHGFGIAPAVGAAVAALAQGSGPRIDLTPFRLARFAEGDFHPPDAVL